MCRQDDDVRRESVKFLTSDRSSRLLAYKTADGRLVISEALPIRDTKEFMYFLRTSGIPVTKDNIWQVVQYGNLPLKSTCCNLLSCSSLLAVSQDPCR